MYKAERMLLFSIQAFSWNCPQHITPRYTVEEIEKAFGHPAWRSNCCHHGCNDNIDWPGGIQIPLEQSCACLKGVGSYAGLTVEKVPEEKPFGNCL